jgi:hypothetical protein
MRTTAAKRTLNKATARLTLIMLAAPVTWSCPPVVVLVKPALPEAKVGAVVVARDVALLVTGTDEAALLETGVTGQTVYAD